MIPLASDQFSRLNDDHQQWLSTPARAPCALDSLNAARSPDEPLKLTRADSLQAGGWVLNARMEAPREFALVLVGEENSYLVKATTGIQRQDVARAVNAGTAAYAGFRADARLGNLEPGEYVVRIAQDTHGSITLCPTRWRVEVSG
ncbi:hypothetical protein LDO32_08000 [Luteimonas sp. Y-2-2-4F]|nr:hypothetical protein [Luteimonas sp. Y-2-2-4F]MCD9031666.1 hypothetical protein [Luteimonas sp. Y-2-2-4F]